jgi:hypothetical protein
MKSRAAHYFIIGSFVTLYLLVSIISTIHVVDFFKLSNPTWLAISLAIGFEVGAAASLASIIVLDKMNRGIVWGLFILLTAMQAMGNTYYAFSHLENFTGWVELFGLQEEDLIYQKRILAIISGAVLPIVALGFIKSLVDYIKPEEPKAEPEILAEEPKISDLPESTIPQVSDDFQIGNSGAYEHTDEPKIESPKPIKTPKVKKETQPESVKSTGPIEVDLTKPRHIDLLEIPDRDTRRLSADERLSRGITQ